MTADRRRQPRYWFRVKLAFASDSAFYAASSENLSEGGIFLATRQNLGVGTIVGLELDLPNRAEKICVVGEIRWVREGRTVRTDDGRVAPRVPGVGIQFRELSAPNLEAIREFIQLGGRLEREG